LKVKQILLSTRDVIWTTPPVDAILTGKTASESNIDWRCSGMTERFLFGHDLSETYNFNEDLVIELLEEIAAGDETLCKCSICAEDMYALSLTMLRPRYHPDIFSENAYEDKEASEAAVRSEAEEAVREAIRKVREEPHH